MPSTSEVIDDWLRRRRIGGFHQLTIEEFSAAVARMTPLIAAANVRLKLVADGLHAHSQAGPS